MKSSEVKKKFSVMTGEKREGCVVGSWGSREIDAHGWRFARKREFGKVEEWCAFGAVQGGGAECCGAFG